MNLPALFCFLTLLLLATAQYRVTNHTQNSTTQVLTLQYSGNDTYYVKNTSTIYKTLKMVITCHSYQDLSFQITDVDGTRFTIPKVLPFQTDPLAKATFPMNLSLFLFTYTSSPFHFKLIRKSDNEILFDSSVGSLIFSKYYMEISTKTSTKKMWGFGERYENNFGIQPGKYTIWNKDKGERVDHQQGYQTYGFYPAYLAKSNSGDWYFTHLRNSNAMDVIVANENTTAFKMTYKIIGGIFDFRFILGSDPEATLDRFHVYLGRSAVPPFWAMGFHQSRWGYHNVSMLEDVAKGYETNNIPLDTIWTDIDYMVDFQDFTIDEKRFPLDRMAKLSENYHMVPIIDAGIKIGNGVGYTEGHKMDIFIKDPHGEEAKGWVWPGSTVFVDWFHPNATNYWVKMLSHFRKSYNFSGIWLDMNEISNFCNGPCVMPTGEKIFDYTHDIPYSPGTDTIEADTISMNNTHYGNISQADVHSFYGMMETYATHQYLQGIGLRPFVLTRSSTFGSNKYGFHWTGDNVASWDFLRNSINENFMFQFWGIQMVGADICGYTDNTTEELCARWFQLGSFYPFSRNHNDQDKTAQEAYALGPNVLESARVNLKLRYSLLKEYYKHFVQQRGLGVVFKPLFFEFPDDMNTYSDNPMHTQFLIGKNLMGAPIVTKNATTRLVYFPAGDRWFGFHTGREYHDESFATVTNKITDEIPLFLREGYFLLTQDTTNVTKTSQLNNVFHIRGALRHTNDSVVVPSRYTARGSMLSIADYNDQTKLSLCLIEGCQYDFYLILNLHSSGLVQLDFETVYTGGRKLNQQQKIESITFYYRTNKTLTHTFDKPIIINETRRQNFTFNDKNWKPPVTQLIREQQQ